MCLKRLEFRPRSHFDLKGDPFENEKKKKMGKNRDFRFEMTIEMKNATHAKVKKKMADRLLFVKLAYVALL